MVFLKKAPASEGGRYDAAAGDFEFSFQDDFDSFGVDAVLFFQNFFRERGFGVFVEHGNGGLQNNRAGIEVFVNEVDGAAGELHAVFERLPLRFEAGEGREQGGMNIQDPAWIFGDKKWREQAHVSGEANEVDFVFIENGGDLAVVDFAFEAF